jgi:hypothetical protein
MMSTKTLIVQTEQAVWVAALYVSVNNRAAFSVQASMVAAQAEASYAQTELRRVQVTE